MNRVASYFFILLLAFCGCEVVTDTNGLPYQDLIVVKGYVQDGLPVDSIFFTHTLPLNTVYTTAAAILNNVNGSVTVDGQQYPLQYSDSGYYNCPGLVGHAGKTYTLDASWNGLNVHSETTVPVLPVIDSIYVTAGASDTIPGFIDSFYYNDTIHYDTTISIITTYGGLWARAKSAKGAVFSMNFDYYHYLGAVMKDSGWSVGFTYGGSVPVYLDTSVTGAIWLNSFFTSDSFDSVVLTHTFRADVYSYDPAYYNFLRTQYNSEYNTGVFSSGTGLNADWNVTGDGFGLFIGVSEAQKVFTF